MEKAAEAGTAGRFAGKLMPRTCAVAALACLLCPAIRAQDHSPPVAVLVADAGNLPAIRMLLETSTVPRVAPQDTGFQGPRVDLAITQATSSSTTVGAVFGLASPAAGSGPGLGLGMQPRTGVDMGLRWTQRLQGWNQIDVTAWRRVNTPEDAYTLVQARDPAVYGARVEMKLTPVHKAGFAIERGFLGFQLESGARITIKRANGGPMVYYRTAF